MKSTCLLLCFFMVTSSGIAQVENPVKWEFAVKKKDALTYLFVAKASMPNDWHIYAQKQPKEAISTPTSFRFVKNPIITLTGFVKEEGKLIKSNDPVTGISSNEFHGQVTFIQTVKLKKAIKTSVSGSVTFMACTEERCLPAKEVEFSIPLQ